MASRRSAFALCLWLMTGGTAAAQTVSDDRTATAAEARSAIRVDGELDDAAWTAAEVITAFVQRDPREGAPPTFRTEARVAFDATALYIAVRAFDPEPDRIVGYLTRRDAGSSSEWIHVMIDSYHDRRTAYQFGVNPAGVKQDSYWFNDDNNDDSWDAVWDVVAARDSTGWRAEFRIPFSQLRFSRGGDGRLGFAVIRNISRMNETATWPLLARSGTGFVSQFGGLTGIATPGSTKRLELVP